MKGPKLYFLVDNVRECYHNGKIAGFHLIPDSESPADTNQIKHNRQLTHVLTSGIWITPSLSRGYVCVRGGIF